MPDVEDEKSKGKQRITEGSKLYMSIGLVAVFVGVIVGVVVYGTGNSNSATSRAGTGELPKCDCGAEWTEWTEWSKIPSSGSCDYAYFTRFKDCPSGQCEVDRENDKRVLPRCPRVGSWSTWGECSATCWGGTRSRTRKCHTYPFGKNAKCGEDLVDTEECDDTCLPSDFFKCCPNHLNGYKCHHNCEVCYDECDVEQAGLFQHNLLRRLHGAPLLELDEDCQESAQAWADKLAEMSLYVPDESLEGTGGEENQYLLMPQNMPQNKAEFAAMAISIVQEWYKTKEFFTFNTYGGWDWQDSPRRVDFREGVKHPRQGSLPFRRIVWNDATKFCMAKALVGSEKVLFVARYSTITGINGDFDLSGTNSREMNKEIVANIKPISDNLNICYEWEIEESDDCVEWRNECQVQHDVASSTPNLPPSDDVFYRENCASTQRYINEGRINNIKQFTELVDGSWVVEGVDEVGEWKSNEEVDSCLKWKNECYKETCKNWRMINAKRQLEMIQHNSKCMTKIDFPRSDPTNMNGLLILHTFKTTGDDFGDKFFDQTNPKSSEKPKEWKLPFVMQQLGSASDPVGDLPMSMSEIGPTVFENPENVLTRGASGCQLNGQMYMFGITSESSQSSHIGVLEKCAIRDLKKDTEVALVNSDGEKLVGVPPTWSGSVCSTIEDNGSSYILVCSRTFDYPKTGDHGDLKDRLDDVGWTYSYYDPTILWSWEDPPSWGYQEPGWGTINQFDDVEDAEIFVPVGSDLDLAQWYIKYDLATADASNLNTCARFYIDDTKPERYRLELMKEPLKGTSVSHAHGGLVNLNPGTTDDIYIFGGFTRWDRYSRACYTCDGCCVDLFGLSYANGYTDDGPGPNGNPPDGIPVISVQGIDYLLRDFDPDTQSYDYDRDLTKGDDWAPNRVCHIHYQEAEDDVWMHKCQNNYYQMWIPKITKKTEKYSTNWNQANTWGDTTSWEVLAGGDMVESIHSFSTISIDGKAWVFGGSTSPSPYRQQGQGSKMSDKVFSFDGAEWQISDHKLTNPRMGHATIMFHGGLLHLFGFGKKTWEKWGMGGVDLSLGCPDGCSDCPDECSTCGDVCPLECSDCPEICVCPKKKTFMVQLPTEAAESGRFDDMRYPLTKAISGKYVHDNCIAPTAGFWDIY